MATYFDELATLPGAAGDAERDFQASPPLPGEMPQETALRTENVQRAAQKVFQQNQHLKAGDFAQRGIAHFTDFSTGEVKPVTDATGAPVTKYDKRNNVGWNSAGAPVQVDYAAEGPPTVSDPFSAIPTTTDPKTGNISKRRNGLPWQHVGVDTDVQAASLAKEQDRAVAEASTALGRKLSLDEAQQHREEVAFKHAEKELTSKFDKFAINYDNPDESKAQLEAYYAGQYKAKDATATKGWFDRDLTPEAAQVRAGIDKSRAAAFATIDKLVATRQAVAAKRAAADEAAARIVAQRDALEQQRINRALGKARAAGVIPGLGEDQVLAPEPDSTPATTPLPEGDSSLPPSPDAQPSQTSQIASPDSTVIPGLAEAQKKSTEVAAPEKPDSSAGLFKNFIGSLMNHAQNTENAVVEMGKRAIGMSASADETKQERHWRAELESGQYSADNPYRPGGPKAGITLGLNPTMPLIPKVSVGADYVNPARQYDFSTGVAHIVPDIAGMIAAPEAMIPAMLASGSAEGATQAEDEGKSLAAGALKGGGKTALTLALFGGAGKIAGKVLPAIEAPLARGLAAAGISLPVNAAVDASVNSLFGGNAIPQTPAEWAERGLFALFFAGHAGVHEAGTPGRITSAMDQVKTLPEQIQLAKAQIELLDGAEPLVKGQSDAVTLKRMEDARTDAEKFLKAQDPALVAKLDAKVKAAADLADSAARLNGEDESPTASDSSAVPSEPSEASSPQPSPSDQPREVPASPEPAPRAQEPVESENRLSSSPEPAETAAANQDLLAEREDLLQRVARTPTSQTDAALLAAEKTRLAEVEREIAAAPQTGEPIQVSPFQEERQQTSQQESPSPEPAAPTREAQAFERANAEYAEAVQKFNAKEITVDQFGEVQSRWLTAKRARDKAEASSTRESSEVPVADASVIPGLEPARAIREEPSKPEPKPEKKPAPSHEDDLLADLEKLTEEPAKPKDAGEPALTPEQEAEWRAMQAEHEAETRGELDETLGSHELLSAVKSLGGLPAAERDTSLTGETKRLWEASKGRMMKLVNGAQKKSLDAVREGLAQYGFHFDTAAEMLEALENRITTGKEVRGFEPGDGMRASLAEDGAAGLKEIVHGWEARGIKTSASIGRGGITLSRIEIPERERGQGKGKAAIRELLEFAGSKRLRVLATPDTSFGGTSVARLKRFYKGLGFVENAGRNKDFTTRETMIWNPDGGVRSSLSPAFDAPMRAAYDRLVAKDRWKFPAVSIGELAKESGTPLPELHEKLMALHKQGRVVLSVGDFSLSSEATKAGAMEVPGVGRALQVRPLEPDVLSSKTPPSPINASLEKIRAAAEKAPTTAELDAQGKQPTTIEFPRPEGTGKIVVQNTREAIQALADRYLPKQSSGHLQSIADAVEPMKQKIGPGLRVRILRNEADLRPEERRGMMPGAIHEGVVDVGRGNVYLFSDHISTPQRAKEVFAHEVVGHFGVEKLIGTKEFQQIADTITKTAAGAAKSIATRYAKEGSKFLETKDLADLTPEERATVAREYVARLAEKPAINPALWQRIVATVRRALKAMGIQKEWSNADIRDLLRRAAREVERGEPLTENQGGSSVRESKPDMRGERLVGSIDDNFSTRGKRVAGEMDQNEDHGKLGVKGDHRFRFEDGKMSWYHWPGEDLAREAEAFARKKMGAKGEIRHEVSFPQGGPKERVLASAGSGVFASRDGGEFDWAGKLTKRLSGFRAERAKELHGDGKSDADKLIREAGMEWSYTDDRDPLIEIFAPEGKVFTGEESSKIVERWSEAMDAARDGLIDDPNEGDVMASIKDLGEEVSKLAPKAAAIEAAFEKAVPEERRDDVSRYVAGSMAGKPSVELTGREKAIGDRFVKHFEDLRAVAESAGVAKQVADAYAAAIKAKPDMTLPERIATFTAETERAKTRSQEPSSSPPKAESGTTKSVPDAERPSKESTPAPDATSTKNAVMEAERVQRGDPPIVAEARQAHPEAVARAQREMEDNPNRADDTIERLRNSDLRNISVEDEAVMLVEKARLMRERNALMDRAADKSATPEAQALARSSFKAVEDRMAKIDEATRASGAIWGRMGALRQRMIREDFSLEAVERRVRAQKGGPLTPKESADIKKTVDGIQKASDALAAREKALDDQGAREAAADHLAGLEPAPRASRAVMDLAERIVTKLESAADAARKRLRSKLGGKALSGIPDPTIIGDIAVIGLAKLGRATLSFAQWASAMREDLGPNVEPYLNEAWAETKKLWAEQEKKLSGAERENLRKKRVKRTDILSDRLGIYDGIKAAAKEGATLGEGLDKFVKALVKNYVDAGERGLDNVTARVKEALEPVIPGVTDRQIHDAFSDYGKSTPATTKETDVHRAQIRREAQLTSALGDVERGVAPQRTGKQRSPQSDAARQLTARLNEAKRRYNIQPADPAAALRSALDARKTYFRNRMQDLAFEIARKERVIREKSLSPTDAELDALKADYERVKADHEAVFGKREMTDEQRLQQAVEIAERNEKTAADQLAKAKQGIFEGPRKAGVKPTAELEAMRSRAEAMRAETADLKSQAFGLDAAKREAALEKQIEELNGKIALGVVDAKAGEATPEPSARAAALAAHRDSLNKIIAQLRRDADPKRAPDAVEARKLAKLQKEIDALQAKLDANDLSVKARGTPKTETAAVEAAMKQRADLAKLLAEARRISKQTVMTPEERALKAYKTRLAREEADLAERHAKADAGDPAAFAKRVRKPIDISQDQQAVDAKARVDKGKEELLKKELAYKLANRSPLERARDAALEAMNLGRAVLLSADLGYMGLQEGTSLITNPILVMKRLPAVMRAAWGSTGKAGTEGSAIQRQWARLTGGDAALEAVNAGINLRENARNGAYKDAGVFIGSRNSSLSRMEESFRSRWADKIPIIAQSARAMTASLNLLRADLLDISINAYGQGTKLPPKTLKMLGNAVNIWTGRGAFGRAEAMRGALNHVFLAPGWVWSRFQILYGHTMLEAAMNKDPVAMKLAAKHYLRWAAGMATLYGTLNFLYGDDPETDPRSSKFGMVKVGSKLYDFSAATISPLVFLSRMISGQRLTNNGEVVQLRHQDGSTEKKKFGAKNTADLAFKFAQGKLAPVPGYLLDVSSGEDIMGRPANWATALLNRTLPLTPRQMTQIAMDDGKTDEKTAAALLQFIGINSRDEKYNAAESMKSDPVYKIVEGTKLDPRGRASSSKPVLPLAPARKKQEKKPLKAQAFSGWN